MTVSSGPGVAAARPVPAANSDTGLPPELRVALAAYPTPVADEAARVLSQLLHERIQDPSPGSWQGSRLTGDGFPVEVAFTTTDDRLRLVVEPGPARLDPARRLELSQRRIVSDGGTGLPGGVAEVMAQAQTLGPLRYGAWVGCRVSGGKSAYKVYTEIPDPRWRWPGCAAPELPDRDVALRMVACTPATGDLESYLRVPSLMPEHLPAVLAPAGLADQSNRLVAEIEALYGHAVRGRLPGPSVGISYVSGTASTKVTLHFYARALWGDDGRIRAHFSEAATALGWDCRSYRAVTEPLATAKGWRTRHGILGVSLDDSATPTLTVGVRPVTT